MKLLQLSLLLLLCLSILPISYLQADGVEDETKEVLRGAVDNYNLSVHMVPPEPKLGQIQFRIFPTDRVTGSPIQKAIITVIIRHNEEAFQSRAVNTPSSPNMYIANLTFEKEGDWQTEIKISTLPGKDSSMYFPIFIEGDNTVSGTEAGIFFLFVFMVLVVGAIFLTLRYRKKRIIHAD